MDSEITQVQVDVSVDESDGAKLDVIPVQIVDDEDSISFHTIKDMENDPQHLNLRTKFCSPKYYKQTYRQAWEQMPDFAGWLQGVEGQPTRAFCIYCQKTLHAHRLSLLKHTCTMRHQKAAQLHLMKKKKTTMIVDETEANFLTDDHSTGDDMVHEEDDMGEMTENVVEDENLNEFEQDQVEDEEDNETMEATKHVLDSKDGTVSPISTKVIDAVKGCPVSGLQVSLYKLVHGRWTYINEGFTGHNGRFSKFLDGQSITPGRYKIHYDVDRYFESKKQHSLYPFIEIVFDYRGVNSTYNIPLILSPNGYTTYKG